MANKNIVINTHQISHFKKLNTLLIGLSMAIGWGIRGNFGHQFGAAFAGCLAAITMCVLSGREDWKSKVLYFAFFGAVGWGFGATISYMQVISYAESGQAATQWFGYAGLFVIGFMWAALGVAATALVAAATPENLMKLFKVVLYVFAAWFILDLIEDPLSNVLQPDAAFDHTNSRQRNPLYWLDANYLPPCFALIAACVYDLNNRKERNMIWLPLFAVIGACAGWMIRYGIVTAGWENRLNSLLTFKLGDLTYMDPATGKPAYAAGDLLTNWPQWFTDYPNATGWFAGLIGGIIIYFKRFGKFRDGSSLIVYMAGGWMIFFIAFPVLGSLFFRDYGGIRMTPPRSDDWAGIAGVVVGTIIWLRKNNYLSVAAVAIIGGTIGGLAFSGIEWVKQLLMAPGNPRILAARGLTPGTNDYDRVVGSWANWQHQNWHSFLEQSYGFVNGIAVAIAMGLLAKGLPVNEDRQDLPFKKWMLGTCAVFVLLVIPYVNLVKNPEVWGHTLKPEIWTRTINDAGKQETVPALWNAPYVGRLPSSDFLQLTPEWWFNTIWIMLLIIVVLLVIRHFKRPLPIVPATWTGKGQLFLLILLWTMVIGNFERELTQWSPERLLTEWMITADAVVLTYFILTLPKTSVEMETGIAPFKPLYNRGWKVAIFALLVSAPFFLVSNRMVYHYDPNEVLDAHKYHLRFGSEADWRARPILKKSEHK